MTRTRSYLWHTLLLLFVVGLVACRPAVDAGGGGVVPQVTSNPLTGGTYIVTPEPANVITVEGIGQAAASPDVAYVQLGVEATDPEPGPAVNLSTDRMDAVIAAIVALGIESKDIQTVNYALYTEQPTDREGVLGERYYRSVHEIRVTLRDISRVGELMGVALDAGANQVNSVSFGVLDAVALERQARDLAISAAKSKAEQLAAGLGLQVGKVRQVSEYGGTVYPETSQVYGMGGGGSVPIQAGQFNVTVHVSVVFEIAE